MRITDEHITTLISACLIQATELAPLAWDASPTDTETMGRSSGLTEWDGRYLRVLTWQSAPAVAAMVRRGLGVNGAGKPGSFQRAHVGNPAHIAAAIAGRTQRSEHPELWHFIQAAAQLLGAERKAV